MAPLTPSNYTISPPTGLQLALALAVVKHKPPDQGVQGKAMTDSFQAKNLI
jgi:hypothetical protein